MRRGRLAVGLVLAVAAGATVAATGHAASLALTAAKLTLFDRTVTHGTVTCTATTGIEDAFAQQDLAAATHDTTSLDVRYDSGNKNRRSFIKFNLTTCGIPAGAAAEAATLNLFLFNAPTRARSFNVNVVTGPWSETALTWNNQPTVAAIATTTIAAGTTNNVWRSADVTADVNAFLAGGANYGWRISDPLAPNDQSQFSSSENSTTANRPTLVVSYVG
jgi:hypothetical protein